MEATMEKKINSSVYLDKIVFENFNKRCKREARKKSNLLSMFVEYYVKFGADDIIKAVQDAEIEERI